MENTKYGKRREGRWTPIRVKAQDTRANPNSWETHLVRKRWDIGLLRALSLRIMMMMMHSFIHSGYFYNTSSNPLLLIRGAPDTARIAYCAGISGRSATGNCE